MPAATFTSPLVSLNSQSTALHARLQDTCPQEPLLILWTGRDPFCARRVPRTPQSSSLRASLLAPPAVALLACAGQARAGRYLLFTTQRSGSTWFCDVLARQPGVECGVEGPGELGHPSRESELMIKYSHMKHKLVEGYNYSIKKEGNG